MRFPPDCMKRMSVVTEVKGQSIGPKFKDLAIQAISDCLTLEYGTERFSRNVGNYNLHCIRSQKSDDVKKILIISITIFFLLFSKLLF